jgi:hypothetical protein
VKASGVGLQCLAAGQMLWLLLLLLVLLKLCCQLFLCC